MDQHKRKQMLNTPCVSLVIIVLLAFQNLPCFAIDIFGEGLVHHALNHEEFTNLYAEGKTITNCIISADDIAWAIQQQPSPKRLHVKDSVVIGETPWIFKTPPDVNDLNIHAPTPYFTNGVELEFDDSSFLNMITLSHIDFTNHIFFTHCKFCEQVFFEDNIFDSPGTCDCSFSSCEFDGPVLFKNTVFSMQPDFSSATFRDWVDYSKVTFNSPPNFTKTTFEQEALFVGVHFRGGNFERTSFMGESDFQRAVFVGTDFYMARFKENANFQGATIANLNFEDVQFQGNAFFSKAALGNLQFSGGNFEKDALFLDLGISPPNLDLSKSQINFYSINFHGRARFDGSSLLYLGFNHGFGDKNTQDSFLLPSISFDKEVSFKGLKAGTVKFTGVYFGSLAAFSGMNIETRCDFVNTTFEGIADFTDAVLPSHNPLGSALNANVAESGIVLSDTRFYGNIFLQPEQLMETQSSSGLVFFKSSSPTKLLQPNTATWLELEDAFARSGNLAAKNEAHYQRRLMDKGCISLLSWLLWGFGVRPIRLVFWIMVGFALFSFAYWTQMEGVSGGATARLNKALQFSFQTAWKWDFAFRNARTPFFGLIMAIERAGFITGLFFLLRSVSNVSPLLHDLIGELLPR